MLTRARRMSVAEGILRGYEYARNCLFGERRSRLCKAVGAMAAARLAAVSAAQMISLGKDKIRAFEVAVFCA